MPLYVYSTVKADNTFSKGEFKASTISRAKSLLEKDGSMVVYIKRKIGTEWYNNLDIGMITRQDKIFFTRHLHAFIESGISLHQAISIAAEQMEKKQFKKVIQDIQAHISQGQTLSSALARYDKYFSKYYINMIKIGEESGKLDENLNHLLEQQEKDYDLISKARGALIYPIIIICTAIIAVIFLMTFVIPTIATVLIDYGGTLPLPTRILIATSNFVVNYGVFLLPSFILFCFGLWSIGKTERGKFFFEALAFKLPVFGKIFKEFNLARFSRAMTAPILSGVSLERSLSLTAEAFRNSHYRESIRQSEKYILRGIPLSEILQGYPELYPPNVTRMLEIGEKTGKLDNMVSRIASFYEKSLFNTFSNLSSVIEPVLIVFLGLVVAFVAVSILTPIWRFAETI